MADGLYVETFFGGKTGKYESTFNSCIIHSIISYVELCQRGADIAGNKKQEKKTSPWTHLRTDSPTHTHRPTHPVLQHHSSTLYSSKSPYTAEKPIHQQRTNSSCVVYNNSTTVVQKQCSSVPGTAEKTKAKKAETGGFELAYSRK